MAHKEVSVSEDNMPSDDEIERMIAEATTPNAKRGLRIAETDFVYLDEGAYAVVFVDHIQMRVRKVYLASHALAHAQLVFKNERNAYAIAHSQAELRVLVPKIYEPPRSLQIVDSRFSDVTRDFYPQLAIEMDFVPGRFLKLRDYPNGEERRITDLFQRHGINYLIDSSATAENGKIATVVDFAIKDIVDQQREVDA